MIWIFALALFTSVNPYQREPQIPQCLNWTKHPFRRIKEYPHMLYSRAIASFKNCRKKIYIFLVLHSHHILLLVRGIQTHIVAIMKALLSRIIPQQDVYTNYCAGKFIRSGCPSHRRFIRRKQISSFHSFGIYAKRSAFHQIAYIHTARKANLWREGFMSFWRNDVFLLPTKVITATHLSAAVRFRDLYVTVNNILFATIKGLKWLLDVSGTFKTKLITEVSRCSAHD